MMRKYGLYLTWLVACVGTLGSLYYSVLKNLEPCHLCWYQRIFLFPLALLLGIATYEGNKQVVRYCIPLAIFGFLFAGYQIGIQEIPGWSEIDMCGAGPSCSEKVNIGLGAITLPMLSALNFLILICMMFYVWQQSKKDQHKFPS